MTSTCTRTPIAQTPWRRAIQYLAPSVAGAVVYPYLHNWQLDDPAHGEFFRLCAESQIPLWINCRRGDGRFRFEIPRLTDHPGALDQVAAKRGMSSLVMGSEFPLRDIRSVRWAAQRQ